MGTPVTSGDWMMLSGMLTVQPEICTWQAPCCVYTMHENLSTSYREVCMAIEEKLAELGIILPEATVPVGSYVPVKLTGTLAFVSGMLPTEGGRVKQTGRVGESVTTQE